MTHPPRSVLRWGRSWSQSVDQSQYLLEKFSRYCDLGHLEDGIAGVVHDLGADLHQLFPQAGQRPLRDRLGQGILVGGVIVAEAVEIEAVLRARISAERCPRATNLPRPTPAKACSFRPLGTCPLRRARA